MTLYITPLNWSGRKMYFVLYLERSFGIKLIKCLRRAPRASHSVYRWMYFL